MEMSRLTQDGTAKPARETMFLGANADREIFIFPVHLATSRIGNLAICVTIHRVLRKDTRRVRGD